GLRAQRTDPEYLLLAARDVDATLRRHVAGSANRDGVGARREREPAIVETRRSHPWTLVEIDCRPLWHVEKLEEPIVGGGSILVGRRWRLGVGLRRHGLRGGWWNLDVRWLAVVPSLIAGRRVRRIRTVRVGGIPAGVVRRRIAVGVVGVRVGE